MRVLGNPEKCKTRQIVRARYRWVSKAGNEAFSQPVRGAYANDGYDQDYRFRNTSPSGKADGTSEISWLPTSRV